MLELKDTVELMLSMDPGDRLRAEYLQASIRQHKLEKMLVAWDAGTLGFIPSGSKEVFRTQSHILEAYVSILRVRAESMGVSL